MKRLTMVCLVICMLLAAPLVSQLWAGDEKAITFTILYDNYNSGTVEGLESDWGFACLVTGTEKTILFDTGTRGKILENNMKRLKVNPADIDLVAISHKHGDHTGGLETFLAANSKVPVYFPSRIAGEFEKKVNATGAKTIAVKEWTEVCKDVYLSGDIVSQVIEQVMVLDTPRGLVVVTGCAHPGIVKILESVKKQFKKDIYMTFGGFHLFLAQDTVLNKIMKRFKELEIQKVGATHCTGDPAIEAFKKAFGNNYVPMGVGRVVQVK